MPRWRVEPYKGTPPGTGKRREGYRVVSTDGHWANEAVFDCRHDADRYREMLTVWHRAWGLEDTP